MSIYSQLSVCAAQTYATALWQSCQSKWFCATWQLPVLESLTRKEGMHIPHAEPRMLEVETKNPGHPAGILFLELIAPKL